ncbi:MAG TPA: amino acid ABC transporter permease [Acetobacteraceae bacterium]|nr:amino acid ABC transporter permease [Acetobacteraceae bacterium]
MIAQFGIVWHARDLLLGGFLTTLWLAAISAAVSIMLGALLAMALMSRHRALSLPSGVLVDAMRCVPFLLFAYIVYYGLPSVGLSFSNWSSGLVALIVYNTAYMAELVRGAWRALPQDMIEAGHAFGFHGFGLFRRVILPPVVFSATPMFGNQVIQIIKDSAFLTIIAVEELTHAATVIQATYFLPFASFVSALLLYWLLCIGVERLVGLVGARAELRR